jgi:hypothetical protein
MKINWDDDWHQQAGTAKRQRRSAKTTEMMAWLKERTFADVYGSELFIEGQRETRPSYCKFTYQINRNARRQIRRMANYDYRDHFDKKATYYYFGCPHAATTLVMIDIDVQKKLCLGTTEGAWKFAEHLKTIWPNLYFESSTGGKGVHGYLLVEKPGHDAVAVNAFLKKFQDWLRVEAAVMDADIELVEVKGTLPVITQAGQQITAVKYGQFAKTPRSEDRFTELKNTTVLDIKQPLPPNSGQPVEVAKTKKVGSSSSGSTSGQNISDEELALIPEYERLYEALNLNLRHSRYRVEAHDFAVLCVLLRFFFTNPNADGTLPVRRVEKFWNALHACGQADRPFNHHRFKVLRDYLSESGHIEWVDHRYQCPEGDQEGIACKWRLTDHFFGLLDSVGEQGGASFVVIEEFNKGTGCHLTPTPWLVRVEKEKKWWTWAFDRLDNYEFYSLAA